MGRKMSKSLVGQAVILVVLLVSGIACQQYEYASPTPGVLELRLGVKNLRTQIIPFGAFNQLNITIKDLAVARDDGAFLVVLADLNAIRRKANGDTLNLLGFAARDSQLVMGQVFAPPGTYVDLAEARSSPVTHDTLLHRFDGAFTTRIPVRDVGPASRFTWLLPPPSFEVREGRKTVVTLTLDLDASMLRRSEWFEWVAPLLYISSIQYF
jgi:hypothetical protein